MSIFFIFDSLAICLIKSVYFISGIVSIVVSIRVDKIYDKKMVWNKDLSDKDSEYYQILAYEANRAVSLST